MDKFIVRSKKFTNSGTVSNDFPPASPSSENEHLLAEVKVFSTHNNNTSVPSDISALGEDIKQVKLKVYPRKDGRGFREDWFKQYIWLEYSPSRDAAFCYACRQFNSCGSKENVFTVRGFTNWKNALSKEKGFPKHSTSDSHLEAMQKWKEKRNRESKGCSVSILLKDSVLEQRRYYVKSIAEVIQFLVVNELPLRGDYSLGESEERSLFMNLFSLFLKKDEKLKEASKIMPGNATYTSPEIQNEVISIMAEMVKQDIVSDVLSADVPWFSLLEDGTKDKNNREQIGIGIRYVKDGKPNESLLCMKSSEKLDAQTFAGLTLKELEDSGLSTQNVLSQCYDGASVMSGREGGVQALIKKSAGRNIPYIHCANHRLHLVVMKATDFEDSVQHFFQQCGTLYCFLKCHKVNRLYNGQQLVRLLPQRWSGHLQMIRIIYNNFDLILAALEEVKSQRTQFDGEDIVQSVGLLNVLKKFEFRFILVLMKMVLEALEPANKSLQSRTTSLVDSSNIIKATTDFISDKRNEETLEVLLEESRTLIKVENRKYENAHDGTAESFSSLLPCKRRKANTSFSDFVITEKIGSSFSSENLKRIFYSVIDVIVCELARRFSSNEKLLTGLEAAENLDYDNLKYLRELGVCVPSKEEVKVVKNYLQKIDDPCIFQEVYKQRTAFEDTYKLLATVRTFPCSTAMCESTFSVLTHIDSPRRRSMSTTRQSKLTFLAFEKKRTENLDLDKFLHCFNKNRTRRLQLF